VKVKNPKAPAGSGKPKRIGAAKSKKARRFPPPWTVEEHGASNGQMWPYYINMN
jgi:hypothetical protein